ncbi:unnamed protein product [Heterobilharzia americana]|nr:unnamed protein product [Heterobilharzia americana]
MGTQIVSGEHSLWGSLDRSKNGPSLINGSSWKSQEEIQQNGLEHSRLQPFIHERKKPNEQRSHAILTGDVSFKEERQHGLLKIWRQSILVNLKSSYLPKKMRQYFWEGVPAAIRGQVWSLLLGDKLGITRNLFNACLSESKRHLVSNANQRSTSFNYNKSKCANHIFSTSSLDSITSKDNAACCDVCNYIFSRLNTIPIKREFTRACTTDQLVLYNGNLVKTSQSDRNSLNKSTIFPDDSSKLDIFEFEQFSVTDDVVNLPAVKFDVCQTFPTLSLFQFGNPYHEKLHDLLAAYITYKPEVGYVPGMSFIAGILLIVLDNTYDAFVMFANILAKPCHQAFYNVDEEKFLICVNTFDNMFEEYLPRLHAHTKKIGFETNMFLFDWFFTIFSCTLPLETSMRLWDLYFVYEESALFYTALAILKLYEKDLLSFSFDDFSSFLMDTSVLNTLTPEILIPTIYSFDHPKRFTTHSHVNKTRYIASHESLFAMHQLSLSVFKEDMPESMCKFPSSFSITQKSYQKMPKLYHMDHSARSPRTISDESDGALDVDDQYFNPKFKKPSYHSELSLMTYNDNGMNQINLNKMHNHNDLSIKNMYKLNNSEGKKKRCTNPCFSHHLGMSSIERRLKNNPDKKSPVYYYSQNNVNESTFDHFVGILQQNQRVSTSAEMIP